MNNTFPNPNDQPYITVNPRKNPFNGNKHKISFFTIFIIVFFAFVITLLILWFAIIQPKKLKVYIDGAKVTNFSLTTINPTYLAYNFTLNITMINPNKKIGIYYDWLELDSYFYGQRFDWTALPSFYQGNQNVTVFNNVAVVGSSYVDIGNSGVGKYEKEKSMGIFDIEVWVYGRFRRKVLWGISVKQSKLKVKCALRLAGDVNGGQVVFQRIGCDVVKF